MNGNSQLIKKTFYGIMLVNIVSMVSGVLCVMIDAIITGQFLGINAVTAAGLLNPVVLICNIIGAVLGPGVSVVCTRYMGMAKPEKVNQVFSTVMIAMTSICLAVSAILFIFAPDIASLLGSQTNNEEIMTMISDYLRGFSFGIIPMCFSHGLTGLMMLDNDKKRSILGIVVTLAADVVFDLVNVLFIHGGMLGMAVATSLSSLLGAFVVASHFFRKKRILHFTGKGLSFSDLKEAVLCGIPNAINIGCLAVRGIFFNYLLLFIATSGTVAALSVANSAFSIFVSISLGMFASTSTMCSLLYGEEDREGLSQALMLSMRSVFLCFAAITALLLALAGPFARLFLDSSASEELAQAAKFIRLMALRMFIVSVSISLSGAYQGVRKLVLNYTIDMLREGVLTVLCALIFGGIFGLAGFEFSFIISGALLLLFVLLVPILKNKRFSIRPKDLLLLPDSFGSSPEDTFTASITDMDGVMKASLDVMQFCSQKGMEKRLSMMMSLFIEEMAGNTVQHGFPNGRQGHIDVRILCKPDTLVIRLRDDGVPFDPVDWLKRNHPDDPSSGAGIRIIIGLAQDIRYVPAMGLNNMIITVKQH
ncbi:MAG: ATP-binding protein [Clostridia bacterium]|nr:ATP-binding protein [Clostridia bacterium]